MNKEQFKEWIEDGNVIEVENIKSETYTYYKCEYISPALYKKTIIVAVYEN